MIELSLIPIWNMPYSSQFNPIETVFGQLKDHFRRLRLQAFVEGCMPNSFTIVGQAIGRLKKKGVMATAESGINLWKETPEYLKLEHKFQGKQFC